MNKHPDTTRDRRRLECFPIVNRGKLWYNLLTTEQIAELNTWYLTWLDAPDTGIIPTAPAWLDNKLETEEILL